MRLEDLVQFINNGIHFIGQIVRIGSYGTDPDYEILVLHAQQDLPNRVATQPLHQQVVTKGNKLDKLA